MRGWVFSFSGLIAFASSFDQIGPFAHNVADTAAVYKVMAGHDERDSTTSRIKSACEPLVEYLFFCDETPLTQRIEGTSTFAAEFQEHGPRDKKGRSLRDFDLTRRMFKYPCSYLVYSPNFSALPKEARNYVLRRMHEVLTGHDQGAKFKHLSADDRMAIREILADTLPDFRK